MVGVEVGLSELIFCRCKKKVSTEMVPNVSSWNVLQPQAESGISTRRGTCVPMGVSKKVY
jgi:hypothetical protein